jgi:hypothetical protein
MLHNVLAVVVEFNRSDFTGKNSEQKVWRKLNDILPTVQAELERDSVLDAFGKSAYVSRYWERGSGDRRYPWIGFVHRSHLKQFRDREVCTQFQFGPTFWSIWIDYPATAARRLASETLGDFSDSSLRRYFNDFGTNFTSEFGYEIRAALYPHRDRTKSDMNDFEKSLYARDRQWEQNISELDDRQAHEFAVGIRQPKTGVYVGADPSTENLVRLSRKGNLVKEIKKVTKALLPVYLLLTGIEIPPTLTFRARETGRKKSGKGGHILSTSSIDESAKWAVERAMAYERDQGRTPQDVSTSVVHYDLESRDKGGQVVRLIEVKGRRSHIPVVLTSGEYEEAKLKKKDYFLYVITGDHEGYSIPDPALNGDFEERSYKVYEVKNWKDKSKRFSM